MQVKKFEAKTMKEALELVKAHLGPEAIILSARDTHRGFGLMGEKSVEVTAAVSEETLRKKKLAEAKLREELRERFHQIPASKQKEFINRVFQERQRELVGAGGEAASKTTAISNEVRAQLKNLRYVDIPDEAAVERAQASRLASRPSSPAPLQSSSPSSGRVSASSSTATSRVRRAAERARRASREILQEAVPSPPMPVSQNPGAPQSEDVRALESQVRELKALVERFQSMPQIPTTLHPGAEQGLPYELSAAYQRLTNQGVSPTLVSSLLHKAHKELDPETLKRPPLVDAWIVGHLLASVQVVNAPTQGRYHVFVGSTGQGKTTTLVKFASHLLMKEKKKLAIVSLDTLKLGATDQLRIYAQVLNVPFAVVRHPEEWPVAEKKLAQVQHILVDAPGSSLRSMAEAEWLKRMIPPADFDRTLHFVQSILARDEETIDIASRYQMLGFHDVIFTRLDESTRQGLLLNFQERFKVPFHSFASGTRVPEDYEFASSQRVVDFLFKLTKSAKREETV